MLKKESSQMEITPLGTIKKKQISIPVDLKENLESYASYLSEQDGADFAIGDIINALLNDRKRMATLKNDKDRVLKTHISMPQGAWNKLDLVSKEAGKSKDKIISNLSEKLLKDKDYIGWKKKNISQKSET